MTAENSPRAEGGAVREVRAVVSLEENGVQFDLMVVTPRRGETDDALRKRADQSAWGRRGVLNRHRKVEHHITLHERWVTPWVDTSSGDTLRVPIGYVDGRNGPGSDGAAS